MSVLASLFTPALFEATVRLATPVSLAALAAVVTERSGVTNIAMEGIMLVGAFAAAWGGWHFGSPWIGLFCGVGAGALLQHEALYHGAQLFGELVDLAGGIAGGVGAANRVSAVRWSVARSIVTAWFITMPAAAAIGAIFYFLGGLFLT